jgi:hypothetical protein
MPPAFLLLRLAFSFGHGPLTIAATDGAAQEEQGLAASVLTTSFQFGSALGLTVVAAVIAGAPEAPLLDGPRAALLVPLVAGALGVEASATGIRRTSA